MQRRAVLLAGLLAAAAVSAAPSAAEKARIERLIAYVEAQSTIRFVRNGSAYSSKEAAKFLRRKFDKMGEHVTTAQQFIDQIASKSSTTGEAYLIRFADGRQMPAARFLGDELKRMDQGA
jgi:Skp family chaperone for outer membrane proteins